MDRGNLYLARLDGQVHPASSDAAVVDSSNGKKRRRQEDEGIREEPRFQIHKPGQFKKFDRGPKVDLRGHADKKLQRQTKQHEKSYRDAKDSAAHAELLLTESAGYLEADGPMEKTYRFSQAAIASAVDVSVAKKSLELTLDTYGPYHVSYDRSGRHMLLAGEKGHISVLDWNKFAVSAEFHVNESVRDAVFLHNHSMFAVAQKKFAYIYDQTGAEVHVLRGHQEPLALEFLPYHMLLASVGSAGWLKYQDVSSGELIAEHRTKLGACSVLRQNPWNAVLGCGHANGLITMWTPNMSTPAVRMSAHKGPVTAMAMDAGGRYMVTAGMDARLKVWDIRKFREVHSYFTATPGKSIDISQRGLTAVGFGSHVQVWGRDFALEEGNGSLLDKMPAMSAGAGASASASSHLKQSYDNDDDEEEDEVDISNPFVRRAIAVAESGVRKAKSPYLRHELPGKQVTCVRFRPYDDVCVIGHSGGMASILVPGSGEPNYDSLEADPFQRKKARQEAEVHGLLDKLPASMISLEPSSVGAVDRTASAVVAKEKREEEAAAAAAAEVPAEKKRKRRGIRKALKKQANIITEQKLNLAEKLKEEQGARAETAAKRAKDRARGGAPDLDEEAGVGAGGGAKPRSALSRFFK